MAAQADIKKLIGKASGDPAFRIKLLRNPAAAAADLDVTLTEKQIAAIKQLTGAIKSHAKMTDKISKGTNARFTIIVPNILIHNNKTLKKPGKK